MMHRAARINILHQQRLMRETLKSLTASKSATVQGNRFELLFHFLIQFGNLAKTLYRLRAEGEDGPLRGSTEELMSRASRELLAFQARVYRPVPEDTFLSRYRQTWRDNFPLFLYTLAIFVVACVVGWKVGSTDYAQASLLIPQHLMENILDHHKWFEDIQRTPFLYGLGIAKNNINVAIYSFALASLAGLGGVYILVLNGMFFGTVLGFCQAHAFDAALLNFVAGHGILELTIIVASTFSGFLFGRVFYMRPYRLFKRRLTTAARDAGTLLIGLLPWLVIAACLEVFVSPWPLLDDQGKVMIGMLTASAFWLWTFWPLPQAASSDSRNRA